MFGEKCEGLRGVYKSCGVVGGAKCGGYKPKWVRYKPNWGMWEDVANFASSLRTSGRADCEVDAGIYEVGLHDMGYFLTFAADYRRNYSGKPVSTLNCHKYE